jgi:hypothetical protein
MLLFQMKIWTDNGASLNDFADIRILRMLFHSNDGIYGSVYQISLKTYMKLAITGSGLLLLCISDVQSMKFPGYLVH